MLHFACFSEYYRKQSRWLDELIEIDRLLSANPTITKVPAPLPLRACNSSPGGTSELRELEPLLGQYEQQDGGACANNGSGPDSPDSGCVCPCHRAHRTRAVPPVTAAKESTMETLDASLELLTLPSAPSANADSGKQCMSMSKDGVSEVLVSSDQSSKGQPGARGHKKNEISGVEINVEQMRREADRQSLIATRVAKVLLCINLVSFSGDNVIPE